jgi:hypothetical protein
MKLDILPERYRLIKISADKPRFDESNLGPNILTKAPAELNENWQSPIALEPNSTYLLTAQFKIDKPIGIDSGTPNANGGVGHYFSPAIGGAGIECIAAKNPAVNLVNDNYPNGPVPYRQSPHYQHQCVQQHWESTGGWVKLMIPYQTDSSAKDDVVQIRVTDADQVQIKDLAVRKVK